MFNSDFDEEDCSINPEFLDPDIVGPGILIAQWAQLAVLFTFALLGTFHTQAAGVKEIGAGLAVIHLSLAIALLVQIKTNNGFSATDAILGAMILDSQGSAISIQMITKETLASRFQVGAVLPCQVFGLIVEAILVLGFHQNRFEFQYKNCNCVAVTWWGRLTSCKDSIQKEHSNQEMAIFWTYFGCRTIAFIQSSYHALMDTSKFHYAEIKSREKNLKDGCGTKIAKEAADLRNTTFVSPLASPLTSHKPSSSFTKFLQRVTRAGKREEEYDKHLTTLSLAYFIFGVYSVASMAAVRAAIKGEGQIGEKDDTDWSAGQVIAVVVAAVTIVRGIWHVVRMVKKEKFRLPANMRPTP
ncbi:hypothetical protein CkaCkLH20_07837 [Colletotrichum karsti]|uniref:Uncharacterized protein n=1 Tax=Colletotrichum karsti TaxID=1095194 RepID=A0A9P6I2N9_9PEZI|nr:uncharacterized protein CkaCkLH20_07837 [Colletotrichum karsti]KAF9874700.1 hypothetical protein CkaCkLH20_07837 [Colletotrichum karsti]